MSRIQKDSLNSDKAQAKMNNLKIPERLLDSPKFMKALQKVQESHLSAVNPRDSEENFSPFPMEDQMPIFDYGLLEALDSNKVDIIDNWHPNFETFDPKLKANIEISINELNSSLSRTSIQDISDSASSSSKNQSLPEYSLLAEAEIGYLQKKIQEMMETGDFSISKEVTEGAEFLKTKYLNGKDDSDHTRTPHISPESIQSINLNLNNKDQEYDHDAPSCEFTFEYDSTGKLITTSNNIEKQLSNLNNDIKKLKTKLPPISDLNILNNSNFRNGNNSKSSNANSSFNYNKDNKLSKSKSKNRNSFKRNNDNNNESGSSLSGCCLFCEYEAVFGSKPINMINYFEEKIKKEEERKKEVRRKLDNAKAKAMRRNKEMQSKMVGDLGSSSAQSSYVGTKDLSYSGKERATANPIEGTRDNDNDNNTNVDPPVYNV